MGVIVLRPLPEALSLGISLETALTTRDRAILEALTQRVRVLTLRQIARTWWADSGERAAESRLRRLEAQNLLSLRRELAHPEIEISEPTVAWEPGKQDPDAGALSYRLQSRWTMLPSSTLCVSATRLSASNFGGHGGRPSRAVERTHDIHMAAVYLVYRSRSPEVLQWWIFEERIKAERKLVTGRAKTFGEKLPDAILRTPLGPKAIEFGGAYGKDKVLSFHRYCKDQALPYEIW